MKMMLPLLSILACGPDQDLGQFGDCQDSRDEAMAFGHLDDFEQAYYEDFDRAPKVQNDIWCR